MYLRPMRKLALLFLFACLKLSAQTIVVPLHPDGVETNEPSIAVDFKYPASQILGSNTSLFFVSEDGGFTWTRVILKPKEGFYGDPVVFISRKGYYYVAHLSKNPGKEWPDQFDRMVFEKSVDGGKTFTSAGIGFVPGKMQDKPWFWVDEGKHSRFRDRIYLAWTEFDKYGSNNPEDSSRIRFAWSENEGDSFSMPVTVSDSFGDAADNDGTLEGATMATGKKGEVFLVWSGKDKIWFDKSLDGGKTWGRDKVLCKQSGGWSTDDVKGLMRSNSMPFITSNSKGHLYVVFGDRRNGDQDVFYLFSKDLGETWTPPIRIHQDAIGNGRDQYMPAICTDRKKDKVYVTWYDRRNSEFNRYTDLYVAELKGAKPGKNYRITNEPFCVPDTKVFFGDYISIAASDKVMRVAYTTWDNERKIATVLVAMPDVKAVQKGKAASDIPAMQVIQLKDTNMVYIHFNLPGYKSCTLEMARGDQVFFKELFDPLQQAHNEVMVPVSKLPAGVYKVTLSFKGRKLEQDFYVERR